MKLLLFLSEITSMSSDFAILITASRIFSPRSSDDPLDMLVIAEGVEEEKQVKMLKRLGCDYIQGYYFAKPMPKKDYVKLLQKSR